MSLLDHWVTESALSAADRKALPDSAFVFPSKRSYPIHDKAHAVNALARSSGKPEEAAVRAAVHARYPALKEALREDWSERAREAAAEARRHGWKDLGMETQRGIAGQVNSAIDSGMSTKRALAHVAGRQKLPTNHVKMLHDLHGNPRSFGVTNEVGGGYGRI